MECIFAWLAAMLSPAWRQRLTVFCEVKGARAVILTADAGRGWDSVLRRLDWTRMEIGGVIMYRVSRGLLAFRIAIAKTSRAARSRDWMRNGTASIFNSFRDIALMPAVEGQYS
jgi:hypothetical protein